MLDEMKVKEGDPICLVFDQKFSHSITQHSLFSVKPTKIVLAYKEGAVTLAKNCTYQQQGVSPLFSLKSEQSMAAYLKSQLGGYLTLRPNQDVALPIGPNHFFHFDVLEIDPRADDVIFYIQDLDQVDVKVTCLDSFKEDVRFFFKSRFQKPGTIVPNIGDDDEESEKQLQGIDLNELIKK
jgi:hypothetical protein